MYRSSSSEIMKPIERGWYDKSKCFSEINAAKDYFAERAAEIIQGSQDIPDFILSAGSLYQPSSSDPQIMRQIETEWEEKPNAYWKMDIPDSEGDYWSESSEDTPLPLVTWIDYGDKPFEYDDRNSRALDAHYRRMKHSHKFVHGRKYCISSDDIISWESVKCLNSTWVVMHGMETVCMVIRRPQDVGEPVVTPPSCQNFTANHQTMTDYATIVISEVEFLPYNDTLFNVDDRFQQLGHIKEKPFGVVSVVSDTKKVHEESVSKANSFLREKMTSGLAFNFDETVQTAIRAFQHLCPEELKAEDIWVTTLLIDDNWFEHMHLIQRKQQLAVISGNTSGVSGFTSDGRVPRTMLEHSHNVTFGHISEPLFPYGNPYSSTFQMNNSDDSMADEDTLQQSSNPTFPEFGRLTSPFRTCIGQPSQSAAQNSPLQFSDGFLSSPFRCSGQPSQSAAQNSPSDQFSELTSSMSSLHLG